MPATTRDKPNLEEMWKRYEFIVNTAKESMTFVNRDYIYEAVNQSYCEAQNKKRKDIIGKTVPEVWGKDRFKENIQKYFDECFAGNEVHHEAWFNFPSSGRGCYNVSYYPYSDGRGAVTHAVVVTYDITKLKLAEEALQSELSSLKGYLFTDRLSHEDAFSAVITRSKLMRAIFQYMEVIAPSGQPVLITGDTGVGKELIAKIIHSLSACKGEFVAVNIAGLDDVVFSDTLFGHKKGAFTGAELEREGLVARAAGGTLFLDEIGDLNESSQVKLLRLLQEQTYYPLGSDIIRQSRVRIVVATNQNIQALISQGKFRKDLYYRLRAHQVHVPPLCERREDIPLLLAHFLEEAAKALKKKRPRTPPELIALLSAYNFPGNVRELRAMVFDAMARHSSGQLSLESFQEFIKQDSVSVLPSGPISSQPDSDLFIRTFGRFPTLKEAENLLISEALAQAKGSQGTAASILGMTRQALNKRLHRTPQLHDRLKR